MSSDYTDSIQSDRDDSEPESVARSFLLRQYAGAIEESFNHATDEFEARVEVDESVESLIDEWSVSRVVEKSRVDSKVVVGTETVSVDEVLGTVKIELDVVLVRVGGEWLVNGVQNP